MTIQLATFCVDVCGCEGGGVWGGAMFSYFLINYFLCYIVITLMYLLVFLLRKHTFVYEGQRVCCGISVVLRW